MFLVTPLIQSEDVSQNWSFPTNQNDNQQPYQSYHLPQCGKQQNLQEQSSLQRWHKLHAVSFCQLVSWKMINVMDFFNTSIVLTIIPCQIESLCSSWGDWLAVFQSQQGCIHLLHHSIPAQTHLFLNMTLIRKYSSEA